MSSKNYRGTILGGLAVVGELNLKMEVTTPARIGIYVGILGGTIPTGVSVPMSSLLLVVPGASHRLLIFSENIMNSRR